MYEVLKRIILPILKIDDAQPHPPAGYDPHESIRTMRADLGYLRYVMLGWTVYAILWGVAVLAVAVALLIVDALWLWLVIPLVLIAAAKAAILYVTTRLSYEMRWYIITDRSLLIRQGVWMVREITLTFANAQNVRVKQGPLERMFGISNVQVDTAGGGWVSKKGEKGADPHQAVLVGISHAQEVRDLILSILSNQRSAGLGDPDDHRAHPFATNGNIDVDILRAMRDEARGLREALAKQS